MFSYTLTICLFQVSKLDDFIMYKSHCDFIVCQASRNIHEKDRQTQILPSWDFRLHFRTHDRHLGLGGDEGMVVTKRPSAQGFLQEPWSVGRHHLHPLPWPLFGPERWLTEVWYSLQHADYRFYQPNWLGAWIWPWRQGKFSLGTAITSASH